MKILIFSNDDVFNYNLNNFLKTQSNKYYFGKYDSIDNIINEIRIYKPDYIINNIDYVHNILIIEMIYIFMKYDYIKNLQNIILSSNFIIPFIEQNVIIATEKGGGFFCIASIKLNSIINFFNTFKRLPIYMDNSKYYTDNYKEKDFDKDITSIFYINDTSNIVYEYDIPFSTNLQFFNYKLIEFNKINPFIKKYFTYSNTVNNYINLLKTKYNINYNNTCAIMFRGTDKADETIIPSYKEFINKAYEIYNKNNNITFLVQTDEQEFLDEFISIFPNTIFFSEIPRMSKNYTNRLIDTIDKTKRIETVLYYISSNYILSQSKYIICTTDNGSLWISLLRGNSNNIYQYLRHKEFVYGNKNPQYEPSKTNHFLN